VNRMHEPLHGIAIKKHGGAKSVGEDPALVDAYSRFEVMNTELKQAITDWQIVTVGGRRSPRFARYAGKLEAALGKAEVRTNASATRRWRVTTRSGSKCTGISCAYWAASAANDGLSVPGSVAARRSHRDMR